MLKKIISQLHIYIMWILLSSIFWSWIFTLATDTSADKKLTVFVDAPHVEDRLLAAELEKALPEGIEMVKVYPFSYAVFDENEINTADIYIVSEADMETYAAAFAETTLEGEYWFRDGVPVGVRMSGAAGEYISYGDGEYYICLGAAGVHLKDGSAAETARRLLTLN